MGQPALKEHRDVVINDRVFSTEDRRLTGRDILCLAALRPASNYSLVQIKDFGTQVIGLDETIDLEESAPAIFKSFEGDRLFRAILNEHEILWGAEQISASDLREIGQVPHHQDLFLDSDRDRVISDDGFVRLKRDGVERIRSEDPKDETIQIVLNGVQITVEKGKLTFSQLAQLAFPELFGRDQICFTVSFSRGPKRRREGVLLDGDKVRVILGMVFNVSATDKS